jgi:hypothetical protein
MSAWKKVATIAAFDGENGTLCENKDKRHLEVIIGTWILDGANEPNCVGLVWRGEKGDYPPKGPLVLTDNIALNLLYFLLTSGNYYDGQKSTISKAYKAIKSRLLK